MVHQKDMMWIPLYESEIGLLMEILNSDKDYQAYAKSVRIDQLKAVFHARIQAKRQQVQNSAGGGMMPQRGNVRPQMAPDESQDGLFGGEDDQQNVDLTQESDEYDPNLELEPQDFPQPIPPGKPGALRTQGAQGGRSMMPNQGRNTSSIPNPQGNPVQTNTRMPPQGGIARSQGVPPLSRQPPQKQANPDEDFGSFNEESF